MKFGKYWSSFPSVCPALASMLIVENNLGTSIRRVHYITAIDKKLEKIGSCNDTYYCLTLWSNKRNDMTWNHSPQCLLAQIKIIFWTAYSSRIRKAKYINCTSLSYNLQKFITLPCLFQTLLTAITSTMLHWYTDHTYLMSFLNVLSKSVTLLYVITNIPSADILSADIIC
jgi:hypothetical protein